MVRARCSWGGTICPTGPLTVQFSTPVRGAEVLRGVSVRPAAKFSIADTSDVRAEWVLEAELKPRTGYAVVADRSLTDGFGQTLSGNPVATMRTTGYAPAIDYPSGRTLVERTGARTFGLTYVNIDTLEVLVAPVPDSLEHVFLARSEWSWRELWPALLADAERRRIPVRGERDRVRVYGVPLSPPAARGGSRPALMAVQITSTRLDSASRTYRPIALVQVSDLGVHARVGAEEAAVWVTGAEDGRPRAGATVTLHDSKGRVLGRAKSDSTGLVRLRHFAPQPAADTADVGEDRWSGFQGYVSVALGADRAVLGINDYDPDLSPWRFNVQPAWGGERLPRPRPRSSPSAGIYRPGEPLFAKAIVRTGPLGALATPGAGDSLRWLFHDRADESGEAGVLRDTHRRALPASAPASSASRSPPTRRWVSTGWRRSSSARGAGPTSPRRRYRVAEYRPPEFLVEVAADSGARFAGDSVGARGRGALPVRRADGPRGGAMEPPPGVAALRRGRHPRHRGVLPWVTAAGGTRSCPSRRAPVRVSASGLDTLDAARPPSASLAARRRPTAGGRRRPRSRPRSPT